MNLRHPRVHSLGKWLSCAILGFFTISVSAAEDAPLRIAVMQEFGQFNPITTNLSSTAALSDFVIRGITNRNAKGEVVPDLVEEIPTFKNHGLKRITVQNKPKLFATWKIKAAAKWGDDKTVTCEDWFTSWKIGLSDNVSTTDRSLFTKIEKIEWPVSNKICQVTYADDSWTYDRDLPTPIPTSWEKPIFEKWGQQKEAYDQNSKYVTDPTNPGLYNGPYTIRDFKLSSHLVMVANAHFYGKSALITPVLVRFFADSGTLRAHLAAEDVNLISGIGFPPDLSLSLSEEYANNVKAKFQVAFSDSPSFQSLFPNLESDLFKDKKVREAFDLSIDRKDLTRAFFKDKFQPAYTYLPPQSPAFRQRPSTFNLAKAKELLDQAGWKLGENGLRRKDGKDLTVSFRTSAGIKFNETLQTYLCNQFSRLGAHCLIENQPPRVLLGDTVSHGNFTLAMFGQPVMPDASLQYLFSSTEIPSAKNSFAGQNICRLNNSKVDKLLVDFDQEWDAGKRIKLTQKMEELVLAEHSIFPLYHRREATLIPTKLKGFQVNVDGMSFFQPEYWHLE